jgi:hypothetical protein
LKNSILNIKNASLLLLLSAILLTLAMCQKVRFTDDPANRLSFSTDTLRFDTVFTQVGSATRILKIYNPHNRSLRISSIALERGRNTRFRINVDGLPLERYAGPFDIAPNDSLYVFAEVTINPNQPATASPFVIDENLLIESNGNTDRVVLEAWGQNAVYLPSRFSKNRVTGYDCNGAEWVWDDPRPYVIYGVLVINNCTVRMPPGTRVHVHGGLGKQVINDTTIVRYNDGFLAFVGRGRLIAEGTRERPIVFQSDRLEPEFAENPGQWTGIWLQAGTRGHRMTHCIVRNSIVGVRADSASDLTIRNSQIYNTVSGGIVAIHARVDAENCLFYNNAISVQLEYGGDYNFNYCTAANYNGSSIALKMGNSLCLDELCTKFVAYRLRARIRNCIFYGSKVDQIALSDRLDKRDQFEYLLENCVVRVRDLTRQGAYPNFFDYCKPCLNANGTRDTIFFAPDKQNFRLDTVRSKANGYAVPIPGIERDLEGRQRNALKPDAGCYENGK